MPAASVVTLEDLSGTGTKLELVGAAMPFKGVPWTTRQSMVTTWYQGNAIEGTQQVLGPQEVPTEWAGEWNTTRLVSTPSLYYPGGGGKGDPITRAFTLYELLDDLFRRGALCRVTWSGDLGRKIVRVGRGEEWTAEVLTADDIRWKVSWQWKSRGATQQRVAHFRKESQEAVASALKVELTQLVSEVTGNELVTSKVGVADAADNFSLGDLENMANETAGMLDGVKQSANLLTSSLGKIATIGATLASAPAAMIGDIVDIVDNVKATLAKAEDELTRGVPEAYVAAGADLNRISPFVRTSAYRSLVLGRVVGAHKQAVSLQKRARQAQNAQARGVREQDASTASDLLAVIIVKAGETFDFLSNKFYSTPDRGADIARANDFPLYQPSAPPGTVLIIPSLNAIAKATNV